MIPLLPLWSVYEYSFGKLLKTRDCPRNADRFRGSLYQTGGVRCAADMSIDTILLENIPEKILHCCDIRCSIPAFSLRSNTALQGVVFPRHFQHRPWIREPDNEKVRTSQVMIHNCDSRLGAVAGHEAVILPKRHKRSEDFRCLLETHNSFRFLEIAMQRRFGDLLAFPLRNGRRRE
jgi:hypothetical protein